MSSVLRERCYDCFRPRCDCFCNAIPDIANRTDVLIVQHRRERFHPFNTARIVRRALRRSDLLADRPKQLQSKLHLAPSAVLLYPGRDAQSLKDLPQTERPGQLVILDGTWHHAKTLLRDIPALARLPRYQLAPSAPSRYRIRREPCLSSLSTVEATVAALRILEPETSGLDQLLAAFDTMVERQLVHRQRQAAQRWLHTPKRTFKNIPRELLGDLNDIVVVYGEAYPGVRGQKRVPAPPVYWVAERLGTGERFSCAIQPACPFPADFWQHLELTPNDFAQAVSAEEARHRWEAFCRNDDVVVAGEPGSGHLLQQLVERPTPCLVLKSVDVSLPLPDLAAAPLPYVAPLPGRAGNRLAAAVALAGRLRALALQHVLSGAREPEFTSAL